MIPPDDDGWYIPWRLHPRQVGICSSIGTDETDAPRSRLRTEYLHSLSVSCVDLGVVVALQLSTMVVG